MLLLLLGFAAAMGFLRVVGKELARGERAALTHHLLEKQRRATEARRRTKETPGPSGPPPSS